MLSYCVKVELETPHETLRHKIFSSNIAATTGRN